MRRRDDRGAGYLDIVGKAGRWGGRRVKQCSCISGISNPKEAPQLPILSFWQQQRSGISIDFQSKKAPQISILRFLTSMLLYSWCFLDCINSPSTLTNHLKNWYLPIRYFPPMITNLTRELRLLKIGGCGILGF